MYANRLKFEVCHYEAGKAALFPANVQNIEPTEAI
jgi:hypothetical protein